MSLFDWEQHKLGNMANILRGASPRPIKDKKWFDTNSRIGWIRISDVTSQNGRVYTLGQHLSKKGQEKTHVVSSQTLLLSIAASVGYPVITYVETGVHDGFIIFDKPKFNLDFMFFKLQSIQNIWSKYGQPGSQVNINSSIVANTSISIPNIKEQKKISILLKKIEENIHLQQRKLEQLNLLKKGLLQKIFSDNDFRPNLRFKNFNEKWKQHKLGSIVHWSKGNHLKKSTLNSKYDGYEVIHYADLYKFKPVLSKVIHWSRNNTGTIIPANSLLFPMSDVTPDGLARTTAMMKNGVRAGSDILIATVKNNNAEFLSYQINLYSKRIVPLVTGTTIRHINSKALSTLNIKIPTNSEQNIISKLFIFFENFVDLQQSKINQLKLLKKFILNNMFI